MNPMNLMNLLNFLGVVNRAVQQPIAQDTPDRKR